MRMPAWRRCPHVILALLAACLTLAGTPPHNLSAQTPLADPVTPSPTATLPEPETTTLPEPTNASTPEDLTTPTAVPEPNGDPPNEADSDDTTTLPPAADEPPEDTIPDVTDEPTADTTPPTRTSETATPTPTPVPLPDTPDPVASLQVSPTLPANELPPPTVPSTETTVIAPTPTAQAAPNPEPAVTPSSIPMATEPTPVLAQAQPGDVIINEVAWAGTLADASDQWIELFNPTSSPVSLNGWQIVAAGGAPIIPLAGTIAPGGYYLLECNDDFTVIDVSADSIYRGAMGLSGESLYLLDPSGALIDSANRDGDAWPAGQQQPPGSMERISAEMPDSDAAWATNNPLIRNGTDSRSHPIHGTPRQPNSTTYPALPGEVIVNEVAWSGSQADGADEWLELVNTTGRVVDLTGWRLVAADGAPDIPLTGLIHPGAHFLIERDDDQVVSDVAADLVASFSGDLSDEGETLHLMFGMLTVDTVNVDGGAWPAGQAAPHHHSMERAAPTTPDHDAAWVTNDGLHRNGSDAAGNPINGTPRAANSSTWPPHLLISEVLYDGATADTDGDEFVELCNAQPGEVTLRGIKVGDAERAGSGEGMYALPDGLTLAADGCLVIAKNAAQFAARFGFLPDFELVAGPIDFADTPEVPQPPAYSGWAASRWALNDGGDEVVVLDAADDIIDSVAFAGGDYAAVGLAPDAVRAGQPNSLQRLWPLDTDSMPDDFVRQAPSPGMVTRLPAPLPNPPPAAELTPGMYAYWGVLNSHSSHSDGAGPPVLSFATARAGGVHFLAVTDDGAALNPRLWASCIDQAGHATESGQFVGLCGFEYRGSTPGFVTLWNTADSVSHRDPAYDTLPELFAWLRDRPQVIGGWHHAASASTVQGFPFDPLVAPPVHLWQSLSSSSTGGVDALETDWMQALAKGWQLAPLVSGLAVADRWDVTLGTAARTGAVATALTYADVVSALQSRRVFATQDANLALGLRAGTTWMGSRVDPASGLELVIIAHDLDNAPEPVILTLFDRALALTSGRFQDSQVEWRVQVEALPGHHFWVRAVQADGDVAETTPIWIAGHAASDALVINEILPAPHAADWNGDGVVDRRDEWVELYNPGPAPIGAGGWQIGDSSGGVFVIPLLTTVPAHGFALLGGTQVAVSLNNSADRLILQRADASTADSYQYDRGPGYDVSLCRLPDGAVTWQQQCLPTPGTANRGLPETQPVRTDIRGARHLPVGSWVKVHGRISVPPGVFGARVAYLQDDNAGIRLYLPADHRLWCEPGEHIEVVGHTNTYFDELQLRVTHRHSLQEQGAGAAPLPLRVTSGQMVEPYEGMLVMLNGAVTETEPGGAFWVDDGTGPARVYPNPAAPLRRPRLTIGQPVQVAGVVSQRSGGETARNAGYRLLPRYDSDVSVEAAVPMLVPLRLPETGGRPE